MPALQAGTNGQNGSHAGVAQLVEHNVANVVVVSSNLITRSLNDANFQMYGPRFRSPACDLQPEAPPRP